MDTPGNMTRTVCTACFARFDALNMHSYCAALGGQSKHDWVNGAGIRLTSDPIKPNHYARFKIQPLEFILANGIGFCEGNVIKYVCRHDAKNGVEDLKKAREYLDRLIASATK